jgi:predicted permease
MAVRSAMGASRARRVAQLLTESAVLAAAGALFSVPVAAVGLRAVVSILPSGTEGWVSTALNGAALEFAAAASLLTVLLFGVAPAFRAARTQPAAVVKGHTAQGVGGRGSARVRSTLGAAQVAFSMILLVLAGLFARSLFNLARVDLGMELDSVATFTVSPRLSGYDPANALGLYARIEEAVAAEPGVRSVASSRILPMSGRMWRLPITVEGSEGMAFSDTVAAGNEVSPSFFDVLSMPLRAGRTFTDADRAGAPRVAVVNESFVRKFGLGSDPIGERFAFGAGDAPRNIEIVGVVADAKYSGVRNETPAQYFLPWRQDENLDALSFYVRSSITPEALLESIPRIITRIDPQVPVTNVRTMQKRRQ